MPCSTSLARFPVGQPFLGGSAAAGPAVNAARARAPIVIASAIHFIVCPFRGGLRRNLEAHDLSEADRGHAEAEVGDIEQAVRAEGHRRGKAESGDDVGL